MRSRILWVAATALMVSFAVTGCDDKSNQASGQSSDSGQSSAKPLYVGDVITKGSLEITITSVVVRAFVGGEYDLQRASDGAEYVIVQYTIKNIGNEPVSSFEMSSVHLIDPKGVSYAEDISASGIFAMEAKTDQKILSDLNPGVTTHGAEVFEISAQLFDLTTWHAFLGSDKDTLIALTPAPPPPSPPSPPDNSNAIVAPADQTSNAGQPQQSEPNSQPGNAPPPASAPDVTVANGPAAPPSQVSASPRSVDVVTEFYQALGHADGNAASSYVIPEKRADGPLSSAAISRYFGSLQSPLQLTDAQSQPDGSVVARYTYVSSSGTKCWGTSRVKTAQRDQAVLIESVSANEKCG